MKRAALAVVIALATALIPDRSAAHSRPLSYSFWTTNAHGADVQVQIAAFELTSLQAPTPAEPAHGELLQRLLRMHVGDVSCEPRSGPVRVPSTEPWMLFRWSVRCPDEVAGPRRISADLVLLQSGHRHLVRLTDGGGRAVDRILQVSEPRWDIEAGGGATRGSSFVDYLRLGVEHLLTGWDHVLFVLALLLLAGRVREVALLVTSFTLAHSITLALAVLSVVVPAQAPVEALIGFSIALLGAENGWLLSGRGRAVPAVIAAALLAMAIAGAGAVSRPALLGLLLFSLCHFGLLARSSRPAALRVAIAFAFGLIHGFGFAGVMAEMELPPERVVPALLGFNLGVEIGQLGVVLAAWPVLRALARVQNGRIARVVEEAGSAAICGVGLFWLVVRSYG